MLAVQATSNISIALLQADEHCEKGLLSEMHATTHKAQGLPATAMHVAIP
jgi:hypothetical protein